MTNVACKAFVLRTVKYGEHDKMLTLFTQDEGKTGVVAKGALSAKSKYIASAQLFCLSEFILSANGKMPYVASAEVIKVYG
jgi:DNA repair protein RecO (recombination protein O)